MYEIFPGIFLKQLDMQKAARRTAMMLIIATVGGIITGLVMKVTGVTVQAHEEHHELSHVSRSENGWKVEEFRLGVKADVEALQKELFARAALQGHS